MLFEHHIFCCTNRREAGHKRGSCAERGSEELRDYMKQRVKELGIPKARVNASGCLDRCELGPCFVVYPAGTWYRCASKEDVDEVIEKHLLNAGRAERLMLPGSD